MASSLSSYLREAREAKSWSQRELSDRAGIPQAHISRIESGAIDPKVSTISELARVLDLDLMLLPRTALTAVDALLREHASEADRHRLLDLIPRLHSAAHAHPAMAGGLHDRVANLADSLGKLDLAELPPPVRRDVLGAALAVNRAVKARKTHLLDAAVTNLQQALAQASTLASRGETRPAYTLDDED